MTGIYRATPMRVNPRQRNVKAVYKTYIDVIHFKKTDKKRLYSKDPDGYEMELQSVEPHLNEHHWVIKSGSK